LVREILVVRALANPVVLRCLMMLFVAGIGFILAIWSMRALRKSIADETDFDSATPSLQNLPVHLYNTVIQQLKQQKHELQLKTLAEQRRARTTENFSQTVLSNLSSGVLVFGANGLVRQANPAAKKILGFNSPAGMSAEDIFRDATACTNNGRPGAPESDVRLSEEVDAVLRGGSKCRQVEATYMTPAGSTVRLAVTISPVPSVDGSLLGVACLISDRSEFERMQQQEQIHSEISAEMALELRTSLATITGYAQQLARSRDVELASQLAADIAGEAARLDRHIGGFLAARRAAAGTQS
jgi:PAS domain-containing protein